MAYRVIYKETLLPIMMIYHSIFAQSNAFLSDQQYYLRGFSENLLDQDDRAKNFVRLYVFLLNHMIGDRPSK